MSRVYKTVRIDNQTKYWLNELIYLKENELSKVKDALIEKFEFQLYSNKEMEGYSPSLNINVSSGSILEAAVNSNEYFDKDYFINVMNNFKTMESYDDLILGSTTPRFYIQEQTLNKIEEFRDYLRSSEGELKVPINQIVKVLIYLYYLKNKN